jgi:hypothetical protein
MILTPVFSELIVGDPVTWIWIHRKMKVGCFNVLRVMLASRLCQFIGMRATGI